MYCPVWLLWYFCYFSVTLGIACSLLVLVLLVLLVLVLLSQSIPLLQLPHTARGDATLPRGHVQISPSKHFQKSSEIFQPLNPGAAPAGMKISASALPRVKRTKSQGGGSVVARNCNCCRNCKECFRCTMEAEAQQHVAKKGEKNPFPWTVATSSQRRRRDLDGLLSKFKRPLSVQSMVALESTAQKEVLGST